MDTFEAFVEKTVQTVGDMIAQVGTLVMPVMRYVDASEHATALKVGGSIFLIVLGIIFMMHSFHQFSTKNDSEDDMDLPDSFIFANMVMKAFYPFLVIYLFMASVKGHQVLGAASMTFDNYVEWHESYQFFGALVLFEFLLVSALCVLRLKPLKLVKYWILTVDYAIIGLVLGNIYLFLAQLFSQNWLGGLVVYLFGIFLDTLIPFLFIGTSVAPIYAFLIWIGSVFVRFFQSFTFQVETRSGKTYEGNALFFIMDQLLP